jgi:hypothetical protein
MNIQRKNNKKYTRCSDLEIVKAHFATKITLRQFKFKFDTIMSVKPKNKMPTD